VEGVVIFLKNCNDVLVANLSVIVLEIGKMVIKKFVKIDAGKSVLLLLIYIVNYANLFFENNGKYIFRSWIADSFNSKSY
jgi:hypothetical protein